MIDELGLPSHSDGGKDPPHVSDKAKSLIQNINQCFSVLCKFLNDFWAFWERDIIS